MLNVLNNSESWNDVMESLKNRHKQIADLIGNKSISYIDIPVHFNVGDLLIYKGTERFFKDYNINVLYRSDSYNINFDLIDKTDVVLLHGGGNFGDIYDVHQKIREDIVSKFPNKRIICLPQTIFFESESKFRKSIDVFSKHKDFHLFVRDLKSKTLADKLSVNVDLMPDMAHSLHPLIDKTEISDNLPYKKILNLVRIDIESVSKKEHRNICKVSFDWKDLITISDIFYSKVYFKISKFSPYSKYMAYKSISLWSMISDDIVFRAIELFYNRDIIYTDRLHGLILASLLGKEVVLYDNSYGKNSSYYELWLRNNSLINIKK